MRSVILIKLGGGLIAPKDWDPETADMAMIKKLVSKIAEMRDEGTKVVVACGSGNFGHAAVQKYGIGTKKGVVKVQEVAKKIGEIVLLEMESQGLPVELIVPHDLYKTRDKELVENKSEKVVEVLEREVIPVLYGDVIEDEVKVGIVFSGEKNLELVIPALQKSGWKVEKVVQFSREDGVWNSKGEIIPEINLDNWEKVKEEITAAPSVDVTGGMLHKVEESLEIAKKYGVETWIVNGAREGRGTRVGLPEHQVRQ
jgi:isopentenyl phosphate kinase